MELIKVDERSRVYSLISSPFFKVDFSRVSNAEIKFGDDFESYFKVLSKSVRQNIRTAYNRSRNDGFQIETKIYWGGDSRFPKNEIIDLYCRRHEQKYNVKNSYLRRWFLVNQNFATRMYRFSSNAITICICFNGEIAGFLSGLYHKDRLVVPRLSIDESFGKYSPGVLLICEAIKFCIKETPIRVLDLSQGKENYKYQLGAVEHFSYNFYL